MKPLVDRKDKVLNSTCQDVVNFDDDFQDNLKKIVEWNKKLHGVGLAAPQIGIPYKIAVIGFEPTEDEIRKKPDIIRIEQMVLVNPRITWHSNELATEKEGCLSIEGETFDVPRYQKIHLEYQDETGKKKKIKARGYLARVIQHETDHLYGLTIGRYGQ